MIKDSLHLKAPGNWINDPNGFIYYKGKYHLFYQHFPYAPVWGTMHWGHAVSEDLVHWEHKDVALFPTKEYDRNGVFSGSAIEKDGKLYLYYSAVRYLEPQKDNIHMAEDGKLETSQAMVVSEDGETFDNWECKKQIIPVIRDTAIADARDTRDPKVWEENGRYYMALGSTWKGKEGRIVLFTSEDGQSFHYLSHYQNARYGTIIECPDLFMLDGSRVFFGSLIDVQTDGKEYANQAACAFAAFDAESGKLELADSYEMIDYGGDLYAPQTNLDSEGRRVLVAWMRMPEVVKTADRRPWNGMMCIPRVVEIRNGHICFAIHPNAEACFTEAVSPDMAEQSDKPMKIQAVLSEGETLTIGGYRIWMENGCVCSDRSCVFPDAEHYHVIHRTPKLCGDANLSIYVEPNLVEIFINDGYYVMSNVVYGIGRQIEGKVTGIWLYQS